MLLFFKINYSVIFMARTDQQFPLRLPPELKEKLESACKESGRSKNAEAVYRLEQTFSRNQNDFNAGYNACMVHMLIATTKVLTAKGIPWDDVQKALIDVVNDFEELSKVNKAP